MEERKLDEIRDFIVQSHKAFSNELKVEIDTNLDVLLYENHKECQEIIADKLDGHIALLDDGIKLCIQISELCDRYHFKTKKGFGIVVLTAKVVSLLISIRQMLLMGFVDSAKCLTRPLIESIDITFACLACPEFDEKFADKTGIYNNDEFWRKNISGKKLIAKLESLFQKVGLDESFTDYFKDRRLNQKRFLSNSIHSSFNSSFTNYIMPTIDGNVKKGGFGKVTTAYSWRLSELIEDIYIYQMVFYRALDSKASDIFDEFEFGREDMLFDCNYQIFNIVCSSFDEALNEWKKEFDWGRTNIT